MFFAILNIITLVLFLGIIIVSTDEAVKSCTRKELPEAIVATVLGIFLCSMVIYSINRTIDHIIVIR